MYTSMRVKGTLSYQQSATCKKKKLKAIFFLDKLYLDHSVVFRFVCRWFAQDDGVCDVGDGADLFSYCYFVQIRTDSSQQIFTLKCTKIKLTFEFSSNTQRWQSLYCLKLKKLKISLSVT